jgi:uncharacterized membrane protein YdjX (TVP38/TMEM64 family)
MEKRTEVLRTALNIATIAGFILLAGLLFFGYRLGIFGSPETLRQFLLNFGVWAPLVFVLIQAVQVVVPILPGSAGCVAGVIAFGAGMGFVYNYIGICAGSVLAFLLARKYGKAFVKAVTNEKQYAKYEGWLDKGNKFDWFFGIAIFLPVAPDDLLCYLAGLTRMRLRRFVWIILLGKPLALWLYSMGVTSLLTWLLGGR